VGISNTAVWQTMTGKAFAFASIFVLIVGTVLVSLLWMASSPGQIILKCIAVSFCGWLVAFFMPFALQSEPRRRLRDEAAAEAKQTLAEKLAAAAQQVAVARAKADETDAAHKATVARLETGRIAHEVPVDPIVKEAQDKANAAKVVLIAKSKQHKSAQKAVDNADKFSDLWLKLSQPEYAIGLGLITKDDYSYLVTSDQTQSAVIAGMALPLLFLVTMILIRIPATSDHAVIGSSYVGLAGIEMLLGVAAADRKHKFEKSSQALIAGAYAKMHAAKKKDSDDSASNVPDQITAALKAATILQGTNLKIIPADVPASKTTNGDTGGSTPSAS
jgi:hypothetical protein